VQCDERILQVAGRELHRQRRADRLAVEDGLHRAVHHAFALLHVREHARGAVTLGDLAVVLEQLRVGALEILVVHLFSLR
jgi:hypothetical protein